MPPKKSVKKVEEDVEEKCIGLDDSPEEPEPVKKSSSKVSSSTGLSSKPMYFSSSLSSSKDSDRIQLIQAINNFTLKGEQLMESMRAFDTFREQIAKLDIQINAKKAEYEEIGQSLDHAHITKLRKLEADQADRTKMLASTHADASKKLELEYEDKSRKLTNDFKNSQIETKQKLAEYKLKACEELAKENQMVLIKSDDLVGLQQNVTKTNGELDTLKKAYSKDMDAIRTEERSKYTTMLEHEKKILQLNSNVTNAEMKAQIVENNYEEHNNENSQI